MEMKEWKKKRKKGVREERKDGRKKGESEKQNKNSL